MENQLPYKTSSRREGSSRELGGYVVILGVQCAATALKAEGQAGDGGGAGHRDEADLVVAVGVRVAGGLADGGIYPTGGGDVGVEYVVDINAYGNLPQEAAKLDRVVEADSGQ